jgi:phosphoglycerate dehydrogenase-like enzyme
MLPPDRKIRLHIQNDPLSPNDGVTPPRFATSARGVRDLRRRLRVTFGVDPPALEKGLREAEILIAAHVDGRDLASRAPRLRWIQSTSAGVEKLVPLLPPDVVLTNASGVHIPKGGEYAMTALLMLNHGVPHFVTRQRERRWDPIFMTPIAGRTVAIVGVGRIGGEVARLARRFGMRVLGVRRSNRPHRWIHRMFTTKNLRAAFRQADFVVVTTPLTPETRGLIGAKELDCLPRHAGLVNLGRGAVVDYDALAAKLWTRELSGAVLDVFHEEPLPPESPLWTTPNVILSPHCAVDDGRAYVTRCLDIFFDNLRRYLAGRPLRNVVDRELGY